MTAAAMTGPWWMWALLGLGNFAAATRHIVTKREGDFYMLNLVFAVMCAGMAAVSR